MSAAADPADRVVRGVGVVVSPIDPADPLAVALIAEVEADTEERYREPLSSDEVMPPAAGSPLEPRVRAAAVEDSAWAMDPATFRPPCGRFLVAEIDGRPAGCGGLRLLPGAYGSTAEVKRLYTAPWARRRNVGRVLLSHLVDAARAGGFSCVVLETGVRQPEAVALYERAGWSRIVPYGEYRDDPLSVCFAVVL